MLQIAKKLSIVEQEKLKKILADPVAWAKAFLISNNAATKKMGPWQARDYQEEMLRDQSIRKVYRCGRRCLPSWVKILDPTTGKLKTVDELYKEKDKTFSVASMTTNYKITTSNDVEISSNGIQKVYKLKTSEGKDLDLTSNHPLFTINGWKELKDIKIGESIAVPSTLPYFGNLQKSDKELEVLAIELHNNKEESINFEIFKLTKECLSKYLKYLFHANKENLRDIKYFHGSEEVIHDIAHLILRFGINGKIFKENNKWVFSIDSTYNILKFNHEILGLKLHISRTKKIQSEDYGFEMPKELNKEIELALEENSKFKHLLDLYEIDLNNKLNKEDIIKLATKLNLKDVQELVHGNILWEEVTSIEYIGDYETYDLHVPINHNFVANDIITHNTGKSETMVVEGLHKAFTRKGFRILYVTPYETQVNLLFMRMKELIHDSPLVKNEVVKMKNSPYTIEFKNGSVIMGFTTGASSGNGAASVRGQRAD